MLKLLLALVGGYLLIVAGAYVVQDRLVYLPNVPGRNLYGTPADIGLHHEDVELRASDGVRVRGWYVPGNGPRVLLFLHGNAGNVSHRLDSINVFHGLGLSVLIIDYRGFGGSDGRPSEQGTYLDAEAAWRYLTDTRGVEPRRIVVFGRSLGGAIAAWLAARTTPAALIVESSFTSVPDLGQELYPWLPVRWLSRYEYPTRKYVQDAQAPVLIVHSRDDDIVGFHHAEALYEAAPEPKVLLELRGTHNDAHIVSEQSYIAGLREFLRERALSPP